MPGPVKSRHIATDINNRSNSNPPTKPSDILATIEEPIISMINKIYAILVTTPTKKAKPPNISNKPIGIASSGGKPIFLKKP